jgi:SAM-dependent methyltransferase
VSGVVDVGCATGGYGALLRRERPGVQYHGWDVSPEMILRAHGRGLRCGLSQANVIAITDDSGRNAILAAASIEYCAYPPSALWGFLAHNSSSPFILHRVRCHAHPGGFVEELSYCNLRIPMWRWNRDELESLFTCTGRKWHRVQWPNDANQSTYVVQPAEG